MNKLKQLKISASSTPDTSADLSLSSNGGSHEDVANSWLKHPTKKSAEAPVVNSSQSNTGNVPVVSVPTPGNKENIPSSVTSSTVSIEEEIQSCSTGSESLVSATSDSSMQPVQQWLKPKPASVPVADVSIKEENTGPSGSVSNQSGQHHSKPEEEILSSLATDIPDISLNDQTAPEYEEDEKKDFFKKLEHPGLNIDYSQMNRDLADDSVDMGHIPDVKDDDYKDDFEEVIDASRHSLTEKNTHSDPLVDTDKKDNEFENADDDDDLESIKSSLEEIENSLDMSDTEILSQLDEIAKSPLPVRGPIVHTRSAADRQSVSKVLTPVDQPSSGKKSGSRTPSSRRSTPTKSYLKAKASPKSSKVATPAKVDENDKPNNPEVAQMQKEFDFIQKLLNTEKDANDKLKSEITTKSTELMQVKADLRIVSEENADLRKQMPSKPITPGFYQKELQSMERKLFDQESVLQGYEKENERLVKDVKNLESQMKQVQVGWSKEKESLLEQISSFNSKGGLKSDPVPIVQIIKPTKEEIQKEAELISEKLKAEFEKKEQSFKKESDKLKTELGKEKEKSKDLAMTIKNLERTVKENEENMTKMIHQLKQKELRVQELRADMMKPKPIAPSSPAKETFVVKQLPATKSLPTDSRKIKLLEAQVKDLASQIRDYEARISMLQSRERDTLKHVEIEKIDVQNEAGNRYAELRDEHLHVLRALQEKTKQYESAQNDIAKFKSRIHSEPEGAGKLAYLKQELDDKISEISALKEKLKQADSTTGSLSEMKCVIDSLKADIKSKQDEVKTISAERDQLQTQFRNISIDFERKKVNLEHSVTQIQELTVKVNTLQAEQCKQKEDVETLRKSSMQLDVENSGLKQRLEMNEMMRSTMTEQFKKLIKETQMTNPQHQNSSAATDSIHKAEVDRLRSELAVVYDKLRLVQNQVDTLKREEQVLREKLETSERRQRSPADVEDEEKLMLNLRSENAKLRHQLDSFTRAGSPDSKLWQQLIDQLSALEIRIEAKDRQLEQFLSNENIKPSNSTYSDIEKMQTKYNFIIGKREEQIKLLRHEIDQLLGLGPAAALSTK